MFGRAFRSHVQPVELARKLVKEMDEHRSVSVSRVYVPNEYVVYLSPRDREQFAAFEQSLVLELADYLAEHARRESYAMLSAPRVLMETDADLAVGEFGIATRLVRPPEAPGVPTVPVQRPQPQGPAAAAADPPPVVPPPAADVAQTRVFAAPAPAPAEPPAEPDAPPAPGVLLDGTRYEVDRSVLTLGRSRECDITIDDASVSRKHAELRREDGAVWIVDLGSTNGTEVNGRRIDRAQLGHDDRILIGQTELKFELAQ